MSIEEVDSKYIHKYPININQGITQEIAEDVAKNLHLPPSLLGDATNVIL
jgi:succinyl-CoA synthetase beta subunit